MSCPIAWVPMGYTIVFDGVNSHQLWGEFLGWGQATDSATPLGPPLSPPVQRIVPAVFHDIATSTSDRGTLLAYLGDTPAVHLIYSLWVSLTQIVL